MTTAHLAIFVDKDNFLSEHDEWIQDPESSQYFGGCMPMRTFVLAVGITLFPLAALAQICPIPLGEHASYIVSYKVEKARPKLELLSQGALTVTPGQPNPSVLTNIERRGYFKSPKERADLETGTVLSLVAYPGKNGDVDSLSYDFSQVDLLAMKPVSSSAGNFESPQVASRRLVGQSNIDINRAIVLEMPQSSADSALHITLQVKLCGEH